MLIEQQEHAIKTIQTLIWMRSYMPEGERFNERINESLEFIGQLVNDYLDDLIDNRQQDAA